MAYAISSVAAFAVAIVVAKNTGSDKINKKAVMNTLHTNNGNLCILIPGALIFTIVVMKFIAPKIEEIPAKCRLKIARSTEPPE